MYDLAVAHVKCYVLAYACAVIVEEQVTGLDLGKAYFLTAPLLTTRTGDGVTEVLIHSHGETGAIASVCEACTAPYIRVAKELTSIIYNCLTLSGIRHGLEVFLCGSLFGSCLL